MKISFRVIASGSNGNAAILSSNGETLIIDAGISRKKLLHAMVQDNISINRVVGILISHSHTDHCGGLPVICDTVNAPIYCSEETQLAFYDREQLDSRWNVVAQRANLLLFNKISVLGSFEILPLRTIHDAPGSMAFQVSIKDTKVTLITDTGKLTREHIKAMKESQFVVLEMNHDIPLLWGSTRPIWLKKRIRANHLANQETVKILQSLIDSEVRGMFLGHLSGECNSPALVAHHLTHQELDVNWKWFICRRTRIGPRVEYNEEGISLEGESDDLESLAARYKPIRKQKRLADFFP